MSTWFIHTSKNEVRACPGAEYIIFGADSELDAIDKLYRLTAHGFRPKRFLPENETPDYTSGLQID